MHVFRFLTAICFIYANVSGQEFTNGIETTSGLVTGSVKDEAYSFYEIPYAVPPLGNMRFQPAEQLLNSTDSIVNATTDKRIACFQILSPCEDNCLQITEDCLVLNVFVPKTVELTNPLDDVPKAVMVYIHGGSFHFSAGQFFDGRFLANKTDTIVVTLNYRLGPIGFLFYDDGSDYLSGNQGISDQQMALMWVQENIKHFGGNPDAVTIVGESAGAQSVVLHLLSNESDPLFHQAIVQSDPVVIPLLTPEQAQYVTRRVLDDLQCNGSDEYNCLLSSDALILFMTLSKLVLEPTSWVVRTFYDAEPFRPVLDGFEFTQQPLEAFRDGNWQRSKKMIIGATTEELDMTFSELNSTTYYAITNFLYGPSDGVTIGQFYAQRFENDYRKAISKQATHATFICGTRKLARFAVATSTDVVYMYYYAHKRMNGTCTSNVPCGFAYHASELIFLFRIGSESLVYSDADYIVEDQLSLYWGNFVSKSDPSNITQSYAVTWSRYENVGSKDEEVWKSIKIESPVTYVVENYFAEFCDFLDSLDFYRTDFQVTATPGINPTVELTTSSQTLPVLHLLSVAFFLIAYL